MRSPAEGPYAEVVSHVLGADGGDRRPPGVGALELGPTAPHLESDVVRILQAVQSLHARLDEADHRLAELELAVVRSPQPVQAALALLQDAVEDVVADRPRTLATAQEQLAGIGRVLAAAVQRLEEQMEGVARRSDVEDLRAGLHDALQQLADADRLREQARLASTRQLDDVERAQDRLREELLARVETSFTAATSASEAGFAEVRDQIARLEAGAERRQESVGALSDREPEQSPGVLHQESHAPRATGESGEAPRSCRPTTSRPDRASARRRQEGLAGVVAEVTSRPGPALLLVLVLVFLVQLAVLLSMSPSGSPR